MIWIWRLTRWTGRGERRGGGGQHTESSVGKKVGWLAVAAAELVYCRLSVVKL